jgi:hypothetical protein
MLRTGSSPIEDEKKTQKWEPRCRLGQYFEVSLAHGTALARVLNTHTGYVFPKYNMLHDDSLNTVSSKGAPWTGFSRLTWHDLLKSGYGRYLVNYFNHSRHLVPPPMLSDEWLTGPKCVLRNQIKNEQRIQDLISHSQSQRERTMISDPVSSVPEEGILPKFRLCANRPSSRLSCSSSRLNRKNNRSSRIPLQLLHLHQWWTTVMTATQMTMKK